MAEAGFLEDESLPNWLGDKRAVQKPASRTSAQLNDHTDCGIGGRQYATSELIETP
jgi:hypothetical protein